MGTESDKPKKKPGRMARFARRCAVIARAAVAYWNVGIWNDTRSDFRVNALKTINIAVRSFTDTGLQTQACAMTYRTVLAIVPALAMLFAIGRGFGVQTVIQDELYSIFPGQRYAIQEMLGFVDAYLSTSSEGVFVGIGLVFLLWTIVSLLSNVENSFNIIWGLKTGRSFGRKLIDYTAMLLIFPVLMICASGISLFLSSALQSAFDFPFMTPVISGLLECMSWIFTWLFFSAVFFLVPNTKVGWKGALLAGVLTGTAFRVLQWLFLTGQIYVTKYNAIYGSFAFLPLMLIWLQLTWMAVLCGALICYSSQSIVLYSFSNDVRNISPQYRMEVTVVVAAIIARNFNKSCPPITAERIIMETDIPPRLLTNTLDELERARVIVKTVIDSKKEIFGYQPAMPTNELTLSVLRDKIMQLGSSNFIPKFAMRFGKAQSAYVTMSQAADTEAKDVLVADLLQTPISCDSQIPNSQEQ